MVNRWELKSVAVTDVRIPREKFEGFVMAIAIEGLDVGEETCISFEAFMKMCELKVSCRSAIDVNSC